MDDHDFLGFDEGSDPYAEEVERAVATLPLGTAFLQGDFSRPAIRIRFDKSARHPTLKKTMQEWVKELPGRTFDYSTSSWLITGTGRAPSKVLADAGFRIVTDPDAADALQDLSADELFHPLVKSSATNPAMCLVRHRFAGYEITKELLGPAAVWDKATGRFEIATSEVIRDGQPIQGLMYVGNTLEVAVSVRDSQSQAVAAPSGVSGRVLSSVASSDGNSNHDDLAKLISVIGDIPTWFGLDLYPFQRFGALAAASGFSLIADEPGLGKSRQSLAAVAIRHQGAPTRPKWSASNGAGNSQDGGPLRLVLICPPVVVTHWQREVTASNLAAFAAPRNGDENLPAHLAISAGPAGDKTGSETTGSLKPGSGQASPIAPPKDTKSTHPGPASVSKTDRYGHVNATTRQIEVESSTTSTEIVPKKRSRTPKPVPEAVEEPAVIAMGASKANQHPTAGEEGQVVVFRAGRKEPELPEMGIVIVPDSLLAARPALLEALIAWQPTALIYDEVHRAKTWTSARAVATRSLAESTSGIRCAVSGTPLFANPAELASPLAITGHLVPIFGGFTPFVTRYAKQNRFNAWVPRMNMLPELQEKLRANVWVRRAKKDVLKDLPKKSRYAEIVDVDLTEFKKAHKEVSTKIKEWAIAYKQKKGHLPNEDTIDTYCHEEIGLISPLRKAAGLAKVPVAVERLAEWVTDTTEFVNERPVYTRPLIVWAHHKVVLAALKDAVPAHLSDAVGVIDGGVSSQERQRLADEFQAGNLGVLVCSITAAGVGLTLTRGSDAWLVETDWTPALVVQAEDRQHRIGQTTPVSVTTMIAPGTLDEHIQNVQARKAKVLDAVMGNGDNAVAVAASAESASASEVLFSMATQVVAKLRREKA